MNLATLNTIIVKSLFYIESAALSTLTTVFATFSPPLNLPFQNLIRNFIYFSFKNQSVRNKRKLVKLLKKKQQLQLYRFKFTVLTETLKDNKKRLETNK